MPTVPKRSARADKILLAAGQLFARQGYYRTTTREIARLAEVSENTLFRHFDHKEDLFWASLSSYSAGFKFRRDLLEGLTDCHPPEVVVPKIVEMLADTANYRPELLRLIAVAFIELRAKADEFSLEYISPVFSAINRYLELNIRNGRIRDVDTTMLTAALMMTVLTHPAIYDLIDGKKPIHPDGQEAHRAYSRFWLNLIVPKVSAQPRNAPHPAGEYSGQQ
jgi:AcrR family transcriptional regulator